MASTNAASPESENVDASVSETLADTFEKVSIANNDNMYTIVCDAGYGLPREGRPRKEKISAIARQMANFVEWQMKVAKEDRQPANIKVVGCKTDADMLALRERIESSIPSGIPGHMSFSCEEVESCCSGDAVYLSPDADEALDLEQYPPKTVVVGLLIDRRVQVNRSKERAETLSIAPKRWPLDQCFKNISAREPLNVDCILEGQQQWIWNCEMADTPAKDCFIKAAEQAIEHHAKRHPGRTLHT